MVKLRTDYITRVMSEDLDKLTDDDKLYVEDKHGHYRFNEQMQIQKDDDTISFIYDDRVYVFDFDKYAFNPISSCSQVNKRSSAIILLTSSYTVWGFIHVISRL